MNTSAVILIGQAEQKMSGYAALLCYRLMNLCVKAEPVSLLPVEVEVENTTFKFEDVADVTIPREDQFQVFPKYKSPALLFSIGKGISKVHPEFKMGQKTEQINENEELETLVYTMPEVNDDRHDVLNDGVSTLSKEADAKIQVVFSEYSAKVATAMAGESLDAIDEVKDKLKKTYDMHTDLCKQYREAKEKEIEDAYQRYLEKKKNEATAEQEKEEATGNDVMSSVKLNNADE